MIFAWDPDKNASNIRKHKISFEVAVSVFDDPLHLSLLDRKDHDEARWITIGQAITQSTIVVVHTFITKEWHESIRIISARYATRKEKKQYEKGI